MIQLVLVFFMISLSFGAETYSYKHFDAWPMACLEGKLQSPIYIHQIHYDECFDSLFFEVKCTLPDVNQATLNYFDYTGVLNFPGCTLNATDFDNNTNLFTSKEIRLHKPSEHVVALAGMQNFSDSSQSEYLKSYTMELQIYFERTEVQNEEETEEETEEQAGEGITESIESTYYSAISIFLEIDPELSETEDSSFIYSLLAAYERQNAQTTVLQTLTNKFADNARMHVYKGSMTVPNCDENVYWYIMESPEYLSQTSADRLIAAFATYDATHNEYYNNNREIKSMNNREVKCVKISRDNFKIIPMLSFYFLCIMFTIITIL